jgi:hypothetical protein
MYFLYMPFVVLRSLRERLRLTPKQMRYQAALCPDCGDAMIRVGRYSVNFSWLK